MIFRNDRDALQMNTLDWVALPAFAYLGTGLLYGRYTLSYTSFEATLSLLAIGLFWVLLRHRSFLDLNLEISLQLEKNLLVSVLVLLGSILLFYIAVGFSYFSLDKIERSPLITDFFFLRVGFWAGAVLLLILLCEKSGRFRSTKLAAVIFSIFVLLVEGNRELLIISGLQVVFYQWTFNRRLIVPQGFPGFLTLAFALFFVTVLFKPLFYIIAVGQAYDGGWFNFGELVNWIRWNHYVDTRGIDAAYIQRFDLQYLAEALVLPFSSFQSSSAVWFVEVLGNEGRGRTFGYSGVLWLSAYFPGWTIVVPWLLICLLFMKLSDAKSLVLILFVFCACAISFRLFRSEWVLVAKTFLWLFFYPGVLTLLASKVRLTRTGPSDLAQAKRIEAPAPNG